MTAFQQDVTCVSHWWGLLLYINMYSIDYIHFLSTTKHRPEVPDYVNNSNISGTSQLLRSTRYQVSRRKKDRERKKQNKVKCKMKQKQTCAQGAGRVLRGQGCCLLVVRSVLRCVQLMDNRRTTKKARRKTSRDEGTDKAEKNKSRPQRGGLPGGFSLNQYLPGVSR